MANLELFRLSFAGFVLPDIGLFPEKLGAFFEDSISSRIDSIQQVGGKEGDEEGG